MENSPRLPRISIRMLSHVSAAGIRLRDILSREAHPIEAAERRQIVAPAGRPGFFGRYDDEPRRGDRFLANLSPLRGSVLNDTLTTACRPWLRSVAAPRLNREARARQREALIKDAAIAATFVLEGKTTGGFHSPNVWSKAEVAAM